MALSTEAIRLDEAARQSWDFIGGHIEHQRASVGLFNVANKSDLWSFGGSGTWNGSSMSTSEIDHQYRKSRRFRLGHTKQLKSCPAALEVVIGFGTRV